LKIELMNNSHLEKILDIDQMAFERDEPRTVLNLKGLREGDPEGCFVLTDGKDLLGYSFNKTMGDEGYLGPVGIHPSIHGQGWGQKIIGHSLNYLKSRCKVIGLEVRPEAGNNIGLYHKLDFNSAFPSLIMEVPDKLESQSDMPEKGNKYSSKDFKVEIYSEIPDNRSTDVLGKIDRWTRQELNGISYRKDLELTHAGGGQIIVVSHDNEPLGFLACYSIVFLHLWGAIKPISCQDDVLKRGLHFFRDFNGQSEVLLEVNTRYQDLVEFLMGEGFRIRKSVNRMLLTDYEGKYNKKSPDFVMRAWHA
jgi:hypothetical protein